MRIQTLLLIGLLVLMGCQKKAASLPVTQRFDRIDRAIVRFENALNQGEQLDPTDIDREVGRLMAELKGSPVAEQATTLDEKIAALSQKLEAPNPSAAEVKKAFQEIKDQVEKMKSAAK